MLTQSALAFLQGACVAVLLAVLNEAFADPPTNRVILSGLVFLVPMSCLIAAAAIATCAKFQPVIGKTAALTLSAAHGLVAAGMFGVLVFA